MKGSDLLKKIGNCDKSISIFEESLLSLENDYKNTKNENLKDYICKTRQMIEDQITMQAMLKLKAYEMIQTLSDEREKWILIYHFICLLSFSQTAVRLNYSERHTIRLCKSACEKIDAQFPHIEHNI